MSKENLVPLETDMSQNIPTAPACNIPTVSTFDWRTDQAEAHLNDSQPLYREFQTYVKFLDTLLGQDGHYVLIKGDQVIGIYPERDSALQEALDRFGDEPVLIKKIVAIEPILEIGHVEF